MKPSLEERISEAFDIYLTKAELKKEDAVKQEELSPTQIEIRELQRRIDQLHEFERNPQLREAKEAFTKMAKHPKGRLITQTTMMWYDQFGEELKAKSPNLLEWLFSATVYEHSPEALRSIALHLEALAELVEFKQSHASVTQSC